MDSSDPILRVDLGSILQGRSGVDSGGRSGVDAGKSIWGAFWGVDLKLIQGVDLGLILLRASGQTGF